MKRIILAIAFFGIISPCVLTANGSGIGAIEMPALQSYHDSVAIAQRLPPNHGAIHGVIVGRLQVNRGAITAKSVGDFFERRRGMPLLEAMSCNYKDRHRNAFYLYVCNDTDMNCELEIAGQMKTAVLSCPAKSWKIERLKIKTTDSADFEARLLTDGKIMDIHGMSFPGGGIQSYSAYGGLCARINIIQRESGAPRIEISDDWDAATEA